MASVLSAGTTSNTALNLSADTTGILQFQTNGTTAAMTINTSQQVGIGTSSPFVPLDVNGYSSFGVRNTTAYTATTATHYFGSSPADLLRNNVVFNINTDSNTPPRLRIYKSRGSSASPTTVNNGDLLGDIQFAGHDGTGYIYGGGIAMSVTAVPSTNSLSTALIFATNSATNTGTEKMRIDSSGNVGIGTSSPSVSLSVVSGAQTVANFAHSSASTTQNNGGALIRIQNTDNTNGNMEGLFFANSNATSSSGIIGYNINHTSGEGQLTFGTRNSSGTFTERMRIRSNGQVIVSSNGSTTSDRQFVVDTNSAESVSSVFRSSGSESYIGFRGSNNADDYRVMCGVNDTSFAIFTNNTEKMRITSGGEVLIGTTNNSVTAGVGVKVTTLTGALVHAVVVDSTSGTGVSNYHHYNVNATFNGYRFYVKNNGGIDNFSANNTNLSDERVKTNIELAGNYLNKICSIPVKVFNYKDEPTGEQRSLGVIAQDVEAVAPELVSNDGWLGKDEFDTPLKSVYETDMMFALMKAIQELKAELDATKAEVAALKGVN